MLKKLTYVSRYAKLVDVDGSTALLPFSQKKETLCQLTLGTRELVHHWVTRQVDWYTVLNLQSSQAIANRSTCIVEIEDDESGQIIEQGYGYWTTRLSNSADMFYMYGDKVGLIINKSPNIAANIKVLYSSCLTFNVYLTPVSFGTQLDNIYINSPKYNANSIKNSLGVDWSYEGASYSPPIVSSNENIVLGSNATYDAVYSSTNGNNEIQFTNVSHSDTGNIEPVAFGCVEGNVGVYVGSLWEKVQQSGYYDLNPNGLYYSTDNGAHWNSVSVIDPRNTIDYSKTIFTKCVYGDGFFIGLVQSSNSADTAVASIYSLDGYSWYPLPWNNTTGGTFRDIAYYGGYFYIAGNDGKLYRVHPVWNSTTSALTRFDTTLVSFNDSTYPNVTQIKAEINFKDKSMLLLQVNTSGTTYATRLYAYDSSTDAYTFVRNALASMYAWKDYLVLHYGTGIMLSTDGLTWTNANSPVYYTNEFACGKEAMVVFGGNYKSGYITEYGMHYTLDGLNWNSCIINNSDRYSIPSVGYQVKGLYYSNGVFIAWINTYLYYSTDGINWDNASFADTRMIERFNKRHIYVGSGSPIGWGSIPYTNYTTGNGLYVGIRSDGGSGYIFYSPFPPNNLLGFTKLT